MGDITPVKILIVAVIALMVLGPEKLPEMTRKAGKAWADFKSFRANMESQVRETVGDVPGFSEFTKLTKLTNGGIKSTIASTVSSAMSMPTSAGPATSKSTTSEPTAPAPTTSSAPSAPTTSEPATSQLATTGPTPSQPATSETSAPATSAMAASANVSAVSSTSMFRTPEMTAFAEAPGLGVNGSPPPTNGVVVPRPGQSRGPAGPVGEPVFAADDPSFN